MALREGQPSHSRSVRDDEVPRQSEQEILDARGGLETFEQVGNVFARVKEGRLGGTEEEAQVDGDEAVKHGCLARSVVEERGGEGWVGGEWVRVRGRPGGEVGLVFGQEVRPEDAGGYCG